MDLWRHERGARALGLTIIAGLDEVGRGPLAGPVVAAAVILPVDFAEDGIRDSKKLTPLQREEASRRIHNEALAVAVAAVDAEVIDRINILRATHLAMRNALLAMSLQCDLALVDGLPIPDLPCARQQAIVGGDGASVTIAAASIVAKVARDALMCAYDSEYPVYGFAKHKGYGSAQHLGALAEHGPCAIHRRSFSPVAASIRR